MQDRTKRMRKTMALEVEELGGIGQSVGERPGRSVPRRVRLITRCGGGNFDTEYPGSRNKFNQIIHILKMEEVAPERSEREDRERVKGK